MGQNTDIVNAFCEAWKDQDIDRLLKFFTEDAIYTNIPLDPPNEGIEAIRKAIEGFASAAEAIEWEVHATAENDETGVVMNERTDRFKIGGKWVEARVMGVFELRDGKIRLWRDYFDMNQFMSQMGG
ncbi:MAG: limonene-1,2-epoxide hydrolase family protein [Myxococcota bacterium]|jgi:limonene-1,2-epoxide hydrolase